MERRLLHECPVCGGELRVRVLQCSSCNTRIEGSFEPSHSRLFGLPAKDLEFIELFVKVRGSIKEMEKALGVSYPTVRGMLNAVIERMGYQARAEPDSAARLKILEQLERGELSPDQAAQMLRAGEGEE